jgi:hypothetical protein
MDGNRIVTGHLQVKKRLQTGSPAVILQERAIGLGCLAMNQAIIKKSPTTMPAEGKKPGGE